MYVERVVQPANEPLKANRTYRVHCYWMRSGHSAAAGAVPSYSKTNAVFDFFNYKCLCRTKSRKLIIPGREIYENRPEQYSTVYSGSCPD